MLKIKKKIFVHLTASKNVSRNMQITNPNIYIRIISIPHCLEIYDKIPSIEINLYNNN